MKDSNSAFQFLSKAEIDTVFSFRRSKTAAHTETAAGRKQGVNASAVKSHHGSPTEIQKEVHPARLRKVDFPP